MSEVDSLYNRTKIATNFHVIEGTARGTAKRVGTRHGYFLLRASRRWIETRDLAIVQVFQMLEYGLCPLPIAMLWAGWRYCVCCWQPEGFLGGNVLAWASQCNPPARRGASYSSSRLRFHPGTAGGPVLNDTGEVIGVAVAQVKDGQNLNFAVPSNYLKSLIDQMATAKPLSSISKPPTKERQAISAETYFIRGIVNSAHGLHQEAVVAFEIASPTSTRLSGGIRRSWQG